jgi:hypothetical protein
LKNSIIVRLYVMKSSHDEVGVPNSNKGGIMKTRETKKKSYLARVGAALLGMGAFMLLTNLPSMSQEWTRHTAGNVSLEIPSDWKAVSEYPADQGAWYKGSDVEPEAAFGLVRGEAIEEILKDLKIEEQKEMTIAGKPAIYYYGTPSGEQSKGFMIVVTGENLAFIGASNSEAMMKQYKPVYEKIIGSIKISGAAAAPVCEWDSYTYDQTAFAAQPGRVFPMRRNYNPGKYLVHVGPAGKDGLAIPPASSKNFGPYTLAAGSKYLALIKKGSDGTYTLTWSENDAILNAYSKPSGVAVVYVRNEISDESLWYAICLEAVK